MHPMTEWQAIVAAIKDKPEDDVLRLVAADWLDEHGESERAEFVRESCSRFKGDTSNGGTWFTDLPNASQWFPELSPAVHPAGECYLIRGFCDTVCCPSAAWLAHGDAILAAHPVRTVRLTDWPHVEVFDSPKIGRGVFWFPDRSDVLVEHAIWSEAVRILMRNRWPGVAFELPAERGPVEAMARYQNVLDGIDESRRQAMRSGMGAR